MMSGSTRMAALFALGGISLAGCGGGNNDFPEIERAPEPPVETAPPAASAEAVDFSGFVRDQFAIANPDTSDPVPVDDMDFEFNSQDDPAAFDDMFEEI